MFPSLLQVDECGKRNRIDNTYKYDNLDINFTVGIISFALHYHTTLLLDDILCMPVCSRRSGSN